MFVYMYARVLFFFIYSSYCNSESLWNILTQTPIVQSIAWTSSELLSRSADIITKVPIATVDTVGIANTSPVLKNQRNIVDFADKFLSEYHSNVNNEDAILGIVELATKYGYSMETHKVVTDDGYLLTVHRIPKVGPVIFLMHGVLGSADDFIIAGPESGLAYLLSNEGYDVWIGNARGNKHSRKHIKYYPSESLFWNFSWHEIGYYDLPAMIDYALYVSRSNTLKYIGHSQGTTAFFVMASERKKYNEKVNLMIALSPVAFMGKIKSPVVRLLAPGVSIINEIVSSTGLYEFLPDNRLIRIIKQLVCGTGTISEILCSNLLFLVAGYDFAQLNVTNLPVILGHSPSGASTKQLVHYAQNLISKEFRKFRYETKVNLQIYGSTTPPKYALNSITTPVSLFYSDSDWLAHPDDVDKLYNELSNAIDIYKVPFNHFNHLDFLFAKDFKTLIYGRLQKLLSIY